MLDNDTKVRLMDRKNAQYLELVASMSSAGRALFPGVLALHRRAAASRGNQGGARLQQPQCTADSGALRHHGPVRGGRRRQQHHVFQAGPEVFLKGAQYFGVAPHRLRGFRRCRLRDPGRATMANSERYGVGMREA